MLLFQVDKPEQKKVRLQLWLVVIKKILIKPKVSLIAIAKKVQLLGSSGSGQLAKMVNQICIAGLVQGLSEAINFGLNAGLKNGRCD